MTWKNLKENKCPKCDGDFGYLAFSEPSYINCPKKGCGFRISHKRYTEIVNSQVNQDLQDKWDAQQEGGE